MSGKRAKKGHSDVSLAKRLGSATPVPPPDGSVVPGQAPASRTEARRQRKQAGRRKVWAVLAVVAAVAVVGGAGWWWVQRTNGSGQTSPDPVRTQRTTTLVIAEPGGAVLDGALLAADPAADPATGSVMLVQNRLFVDGVSSEAVPFSSTTLIGPMGTSADALAVTLDVLVDGEWRLTPDGLAALVDAIGPVTVDVDVDVVGKAPNGQTVVLVPTGVGQELGGADAVAFATYRAPGEPEEARLARFSQVLSEVLAALPASRTDVTATLDALGKRSTSTTTTAQLASLLATLGDVVRADAVQMQVLPVTSLDTGGPVTSYTLDEAAWTTIRAAQLAGSIPPKNAVGDIRVLVENGVGTPGIELDAARMLRKEGFVFVNGGNANSFDHAKTVVLIPDASAEQRQLGAQVARALGVPPSAVQLDPTGQQVAEVIVIIGADFKPE